MWGRLELFLLGMYFSESIYFFNFNVNYTVITLWLAALYTSFFIVRQDVPRPGIFSFCSQNSISS